MSAAAEVPSLVRFRLDRCLAEMRAKGIDALVLMRETNASYLSGARPLQLYGTPRFASLTALIGATQQIHMLGWMGDEIPDFIPTDNRIAVSANLAARFQELAARLGRDQRLLVGVDDLMPFVGDLFASFLPNATLVDGEEVMRLARRVKSAEEIACIRDAIKVAEGSLNETIQALEPGVSEMELFGTYLQASSNRGAVKAGQGIFCVTPRSPVNGVTLRQLPSHRRVEAADLVALAAGVLCRGYEGSLARTWPCGRTPAGAEALYERWRNAVEAMMTACRPGNSAADIGKAFEATGEAPPPVPIVNGIGLGYELPVVYSGKDSNASNSIGLEPGMVLALQPYVWESGVGGYLGQEVVVVADREPECLTSYPHLFA